MTIIVNNHPNASTNVNGIEFAPDEQGRMCSVGPVTGEMLAILLAIPDFTELRAAPAAESEQAAQSPAGEAAAAAIPAITGTMSEDGGPFNVNIPMPDGSVLNLQADNTAGENLIAQGDAGAAAEAAAGITADKIATAAAEEKPATSRKAAAKK